MKEIQYNTCQNLTLFLLIIQLIRRSTALMPAAHTPSTPRTLASVLLAGGTLERWQDVCRLDEIDPCKIPAAFYISCRVGACRISTNSCRCCESKELHFVRQRLAKAQPPKTIRVTPNLGIPVGTCNHKIQYINWINFVKYFHGR